ncbi:hypothetical protein EZV62_027559 [Acer yangbiense]|uniref:Cytochrome P450 n=1 Tax=Acer yangbiense TaxID=1000413 RepID=A0A5C7GUP9_9ROSI|nr:hypothetical protein EZV62_027559 [Acer yangbiense]
MYLEFIILAIVFIVFLYQLTKHNQVLRKLAFVLQLILNFHKFHDKVAQFLQETKGTFLLKPAWLGHMDMLFTSDPANVHYIMCAKFSDFVKGSEWRMRFDIFGDHSIFNTDFDEWKQNRKAARAFLCHQQCHQHVAKIIPDIIEQALIPVIEHVSEQDMAVDLQDLFKRYTFDFACLLTIGSNPNSLMIGPEHPFLKALDDAFEAAFVRFVLPQKLWKLQRWLGIGKERKLSEGWKIIDEFCAEHISIKREKLGRTSEDEDEEGLNLLSCFLTGRVIGPTHTPNDIRDDITNLLFGIADTTSTALSWFFWLLSKNTFAETKIRQELRRNLPESCDVKEWRPRHVEELDNLVYLHAALCETLRLYPPVPYEWRTPLGPDTLPSGHRVNQKTGIFISAYAMGRTASIWGEDCHAFKPERWITDDGGIKHEPPHKFFVFSAGSRICLGKEIAFTLMKAIIATIIHNYDVQVIESHPVIPSLSVLFRMKHGLMARINKRRATLSE